MVHPLYLLNGKDTARVQLNQCDHRVSSPHTVRHTRAVRHLRNNSTSQQQSKHPIHSRMLTLLKKKENLHSGILVIQDEGVKK